ncbi:hypothetical protein ACFVSS_11565 [Peribacillus butanolivorans]|uniref:hypothetical protein n=1 Tax=Peribacillus butanolivorans TaxID=421767 RepID=UPI0036DD57E6
MTKKIFNKNRYIYWCIRIYLMVVLFLYTYSTGINTGELYFKQAIIMFYLGIIIYLAYCFMIKKYKILKGVDIFDISIIILVYYIVFSSILYDRSFTTNINLSILIILMYLVVKTLKFESIEFGFKMVVFRFNFLFETFIYFIFLTTIVAFFNQINIFSLFPIADITYSKRAQSWFNNSTMYGVNIAIAIMFCFYKYNVSSNKHKLVIIMEIIWFFYWLLLAGGRTGLMMLLVGFTLYILLSYKEKVLFFLGPPFLLVIIFYNAITDYLYSNFVIFSRFNSGDTLGARDVMFYEVIDFMSKQDLVNQLFGMGTNSYNYKYRQEFTFGQHSGLLKFLVENGSIFIIIYSTFILLVVINYLISIKKSANPIKKNLLIVGCALTIMLFIGETMVVMTMTANYYFALILLLAAIPNILYSREK